MNIFKKYNEQYALNSFQNIEDKEVINYFKKENKMPDIITPNTPNQQQQKINVQEQILLNLLNQFNVLTMEFDTLFETVCDTEEKKNQFKAKFKTKMDAYLEKVKASQIKQQIMKK